VVVQPSIRINETFGVRLWIDGVGCAIVWFDDQLTIGNAHKTIESGNLGIMADLRTEHAHLRRSGETWSVDPVGKTTLNGNLISKRRPMPTKCHLQLGATIEDEQVEMEVTVPSPLSASAVLRFISHHRPKDRIDRVVLFQQTCLLSGQSQSHIVCPGWKETAVLFERDNTLWLKSADGFALEQSQSDEETQYPNGTLTQSPLRDGDLVSCLEGRFRIEQIRKE